MILYLAADLLWASRIKATAESRGIAARPVRTLEMLKARLADSPVKAILLDLEKPDEALAMLARLRDPAVPDAHRSLPVICWAPHVERDLMARAKAAGATKVLTRGAFDATLIEILENYRDAASS